MFEKKIVYVLLLICFCLVSHSQESTTKTTQLEYGLRLARTSNFYSRSVAYLHEEIGIQFFDGFFARINKGKKATRFGFGFFSNNFIFPYFEKTPKGLSYSKTNFLQLYGGLQFLPGNQNFIYLLCDVFCVNVKKFGTYFGTSGALSSLASKRTEFGISPGIGIRQRIGKLFAISAELQGNVFWRKSRAVEKYINTNSIFYEENKRGFKCSSTLQVFFTMYF